MNKKRLDQALVDRGLISSRSQAENLIKLGLIEINEQIIKKSGYLITENDKINVLTDEIYVSRAALKLKSVANKLGIDFENKIILDVGSSTGGFTDYALQHGAKKVIAVDVGTNQLHPSLLENDKIELHEQTDIRDFNINGKKPDLILIDASFISLREILPKIKELSDSKTEIVAMFKPQFEVGDAVKHKGIIKNDKIRRNTLKDFENWVKNVFKVIAKADSDILGSKGNAERFYLLKNLS